MVRNYPCASGPPRMVTHQFRLELSRAYLEQVIRKMRIMTGSWDEGR